MSTLCVLGLVLAACAGSSGDDRSSGTSSVTAAEPGTTAPTGAPTGSGAAPPAAGTIPFITEPPVDTATTGPEGSGCTPPSATSLPDGEWFGEVTTVDTDASTMGLDLACLSFFDAANAAATAAGATEVPVPDDVWVQNQSANVYTLRLVPDVAVGTVPDSFSNGESLVSGGTGPAAVTATVGRGVWVQVVDGWVVAVQQQYFP